MDSKTEIRMQVIRWPGESRLRTDLCEGVKDTGSGREKN